MPTLSELSKTVVPCGSQTGKTFDKADLLELDTMRDNKFLPSGFKEKLTAYLDHPTISRELDKLIFQ